MTKAAMTRLKQSEFFHEVCDVVVAWDYYLHIGDKKSADECTYKWSMAKKALQFITGELYGFSRNGETVSIVNERNYDDRIFITEAHRH
jgi:hypothetical protein